MAAERSRRHDENMPIAADTRGDGSPHQAANDLPASRRTPILVPGVNCWRRTSARRTAFLVDADAYYRAVSEAIECAERTIWILGWDTDSKVRLRREPDAPGLEDLLRDRLERRPRLEAFVLSWDFAMVYAFERDLMPLFWLSWRSHPRLHYHLDDSHPLGASHHQKVVVVDDSVAFAGGMDLTRKRWDVPEHPVDEPRRRTAGGKSYSPFHDVQLLVDGEAASALGELARDRWRRATGDAVAPAPPNPTARRNDPWPPSAGVDVENVTLGIARTFPELDRGPSSVREVERLYVDAIAAARASIYFENQYLTSSTVAEALKARIAEPDGPEIVAVVPERCSGWLEETTMGVLRDQVLERLTVADRSGRFRVYRPAISGTPIYVHSKIMVVDDRLARVGSANLSNRSMGLDSECDLAVEADSRRTASAVTFFRDRLLAEHLGVTAVDVMRAIRRRGSLVGAIENLRGGERTLEPLAVERQDPWAVATVSVADPEHPVEPDLLVEDFLSRDSEPARRMGLWRLGLLLAAAAALIILWQWGPLGGWLDPGRLTAWVARLRGSVWALPGVILTYAVSGVLMIPLTLLIVATAAAFGPWDAALYASLGTIASGAVTFGLGRLAGRRAVRRLAGTKLNRISRKLARRGVLAVATIRLLPLAPYGIVNMVAGASAIRFRDFALGTFLGTLPGIVAIALVVNQVDWAVKDPGLGSFAAAGLVLGLAVAGLVWVRRRLGGAADRRRRGT
jgi:phospholipase D1/2